eukprot:1669068-Pyramimonas_sp.AAC.1
MSLVTAESGLIGVSVSHVMSVILESLDSPSLRAAPVGSTSSAISSSSPSYAYGWPSSSDL